MVGALLGPWGLGLVEIGLGSAILQVIAVLALVLVLFSDAISVDIGQLREQRRLAMLVLVPGTLIPATLIAGAGWLLLGISPAAAAILGGALASTDPVLLRTLLRNPELPPTTKLALRFESGMNDAVLLPVVVLAMLAVQSRGSPDPMTVGQSIVGLFILGPLLGAGVGWIGITVLAHVRGKFGVRRDYESLYALGIAFSAFAAAEAVGGSGYLAAFTAGLVIAAMDLELCDCFLDYGEATAEMFLLLTFVAFGASIIWTGLGVLSWRTLAFAGVAIFIRTIVLYPVLTLAGVRGGDRSLIAWLGPRGLSSLLLILLPVFAGMPGAAYLFTVACLVVLLSVVLHGGGIGYFLRRSAARRAESQPPGGGGIEPRPAVQLERTRSAEANPPSEAVPERITLEELGQLQERGEDVIVADSRTERTFRESDSMAAGALRLPPENAVRTAREMQLTQHATLVVYCA